MQLWVQVDSKAVVSMLTKHFKGHPEYGLLIQQCKTLLNWGGWKVKISHCFREANQVADKLTNMGVAGNLEVNTHCTPTMETREARYADILGVLWPRGFNR
uniref:RNase H type-1 domain-containing protein n=3 Tax=Opuntia streptacantha TaxID=393608 RepID=A0A7C9DAS6_OPUST